MALRKKLLVNDLGQLAERPLSENDYIDMAAYTQPGGGTDNTADFAAAAALGKPLWLGDQTFKCADLELPAGTVIEGVPGAARILGNPSNSALVVRSNSKFRGFTVANTVYGIQGKGGEHVSNIFADRVNFDSVTYGWTSWGFGAYEDNRDWTIGNTRGDNCYGLFNIVQLSDSAITGVVNRGGTGSTCFFGSGENFSFTDFDIDGGTTGFVALPHYGNYQNIGRSPVNLRIARGKCRNIVGESISLDGGGVPADMHVREVSTVSGKSSSDPSYYQVSLSASGVTGSGGGSWSGSAAALGGLWFVFVTGSRAGQAIKSDGCSSDGTWRFAKGTTMTADSYAGIANGDIVIVGLPYVGPSISQIDIINDTGSDDHYHNAILISGLSVGAKISDVNVRMTRDTPSAESRGICVTSTSGLNASGSYVSATGAGRWAAPFDCTVHNATLQNCNLMWSLWDFTSGAYTFTTVGGRSRDVQIHNGDLVVDHFNHRRWNVREFK